MPLSFFICLFCVFVGVCGGVQGRSKPHSPRWARVPLSSFFPQISINFSYFILIFSSNLIHFLPHFGPPGGRVAHPGRPWLRHWVWGCVCVWGGVWVCVCVYFLFSQFLLYLFPPFYLYSFFFLEKKKLGGLCVIMIFFLSNI